MGGQDLKRERGEQTLGREGWRSWGEKPLGGKRGKGSLAGKGGKDLGEAKGDELRKGGKDLWEEKGEELRVGKGLRRKRMEINDLNRELGGGGGGERS